MKRLLLLILIVCSYKTQAQVYHGMLNNTTWYLLGAAQGGVSNIWLCPIYDTLIVGSTFKKYTRFATDGSVGDSFFLREDSTSQKVFYRDYYVAGEKLLYDFSKTLGQTAIFYLMLSGGDKLCHLDSVGTASTCYGNRKFQVWSTVSLPGKFFTIEQFGSVGNDPTWVYFPYDPYIQQVCKFEGNASCYFPGLTNPNNDSTLICPSSPFCSVSGINDNVASKLKFEQSGNELYFDVNQSSVDNYRVFVYDVLGRKQIENYLNSSQSIDISSMLSEQFYVCTLYSKQNLVGIGKFYKK